ncbi:unnamed protein product [Leuciscus chuanchicus]
MPSVIRGTLVECGEELVIGALCQEKIPNRVTPKLALSKQAQQSFKHIGTAAGLLWFSLLAKAESPHTQSAAFWDKGSQQSPAPANTVPSSASSACVKTSSSEHKTIGEGVNGFK